MELITPQMVLAERAKCKGLAHSLNADGGGRLYRDCPCRTCRGYYDPTGRVDANKQNLALFKQRLEQSKKSLELFERFAELPSVKQDDICLYKIQAARMAHIHLKVAVEAFEESVSRV